ncbi:uncharacterized protein LOC124327705 [Daphnia pulicaria]|uniref:uncharacterized protein LOC124327705 n=1 Tax=Daphnia pulicaria TaxID=35523 RepID=UPI001EEBA666|nr:uncharacterized protein LOC124327705 [Daphnia pulicaria]
MAGQKIETQSHQAPSRVSKSNTPFQSTDEPFNLPIEAETTVEEETVSCDTTTTSKLVALPPQQDPETEIIAGRDLMETGEHLNLPIDIVTTLEEEDSVSSDTTTTSPPHQYRDSQLNGDSDHTETGDSFELFNDRETTVEEDTATCETTTAFQSVASPTLQHPETEIIGGIDLMETGEPFKFLIEAETTRDTASCNMPTTTPFQLVASPPQQDPETEIITYKTTNLQAVHALFVSLPVPHSNELLSLPPEATETIHSSDVTTANETTDAEIVGAPTVRGKKPKRVYRIKAPTNCYEEVMSELCKLNVLNVCCDKHEDSLPYLIMQYVHIRFHTESKRFRNIHLSSDRTQMKTNKKLSRIPKSAEIQCEKVKEKETANTTLQRIKLKNNMEKFSKKSSTSELEAIDAEAVRFCHFQELPSTVLEELVKTLSTKRRDNYRQFIALLMVPNLSTLNLSICDKNELSHLVPLAAKNCPERI